MSFLAANSSASLVKVEFVIISPLVFSGYSSVKVPNSSLATSTPTGLDQHLHWI